MSQLITDAARAALALLRRQSTSIAETVAWGREANRVEQLLADALMAEGQQSESAALRAHIAAREAELAALKARVAEREAA